MMITADILRGLKQQGLSDIAIGVVYGLTARAIKNLRYKYDIPGLSINAGAGRPRAPENAHNDGWPEVLDPVTRDRRWSKYFKKVGHDHHADDLRFKRTAPMIARPDPSHYHGLGATSLHLDL